ncbi:bZIP transcription factor [Aspergillus fumigatus Af293]
MKCIQPTMIRNTQQYDMIPLASMPQQAGVRAPQDDWTGVIDPKERRKLQNRVNQRLYRLRKRVVPVEPHSETSIFAPPASVSSSTASTWDRSLREVYSISATAEVQDKFACANAPPHALQFRQWFESAAYQSYLTGSPQRDHLISLCRLNVHRAINENITMIGMTPEWMRSDDAVSIFNLQQPSFALERIPPSLRPTPIQLQVPHHPWLDFFPFPRMRDLLILAGDAFDDDELCHDLMAFWDTRNSAATLLVWGDSWDPKNWEVTEKFAHKWTWMIRDSPELLASTNFWRRSRGEKPLDWKRILQLSHRQPIDFSSWSTELHS